MTLLVLVHLQLKVAQVFSQVLKIPQQLLNVMAKVGSPYTEHPMCMDLVVRHFQIKPKCVTLNSSEISETNEEICFMSRSTLLSLPVLSRVVMASVAMLRFESVIRFSRSKLHAVTADGCFMATWWTQRKYQCHSFSIIICFLAYV